MSALKQELQAYEEALPSLLATHLVEFVIIHGSAIQHFEPTYEAAFDWAYEHFGLEQPFFVKQVDTRQSVAHFTRDLGPCRS